MAKLTVAQMKRLLLGRRIVGFEANAFRDGRANSNRASLRSASKAVDLYDAPGNCGAITYNPVFVLDDGTRVSFVVHETDGGDYGVDPIVSPVKRE